MMALVDADYRFLWIDVGSDGSSNDASIYNGSELKTGLENPNNPFHLPEDKPLPGDDVPVPYFIIGGNAFGIITTLMNPFSIRNMDYHERIFNYRLSRARRVVKSIWHSGTQVQSFADDHEPETKDMQKNNGNLCHPLQPHQTEISGHSQQPDGLRGPKTKTLFQGRGEMTEYFLMFTTRRQGTLGPRKVDNLEDISGTTLHQRLVPCHGKTR